MNSLEVKLGRPARESGSLVEYYRRRIVAGQLLTGQRLPSREQLARKHRVSLPTAQRAMAQLEAEGWIVSRGRQGTFVADRLPHQSRYALVLPYRREDTECFSLYYQALEAAAGYLQRQGEAEFLVVNADRRQVSGPVEQRLISEVRAHRVGGLIFADYPTSLLASRLFRERDLFHTAITFTGEYLGLPAATLDYGGWFKKAVGAAVAAGRSRIACLSAWPKNSSLHQAFLATLAWHDLEPRACWQQHGDPRATEWVSELAQLWMALPAGDRPDALLVTDDNFVEPVTDGLRAAGVAVPEEVLVIAHFNHPCWPKARVPVRWLGCDCVAVLRQARALIDAQRRGDSVGTLTMVPAVWGEDVKINSGGAPRKRLASRKQAAAV